MRSVKDGMNSLIKDLFIVAGECPECGAPLLMWRHTKPDGSQRGEPTCEKCGFKSMTKKQEDEVNKRFSEGIKQRTVSYFENKSVVTDKELFKSSFKNFKIVDQETKVAKEKVKSFLNSILLGKPTHLILTGKSGSGKSHLAMATAKHFIYQSGYSKKVLFINYRELLEQMKFAFVDEKARREIQGDLMKEIKRADLVILDDLGAELGGSSAGNSTNYNNDVLYSILEARQNAATVFTTNLDNEELRKSYGNRIFSRLVKHSQGFAVKFIKTKDKRIVPTESGENT
ncbi:ATP-binding protein [Enterococcus sp.]|uniref:ATP-binding protein n=1 Tax=Enterococcus sp. TaxID=35783 RepID=UPI002FC664B7